MNMHKLYSVFAIIAMYLLCSFSSFAQTTTPDDQIKKTYSFYVVPQLDPVAIHQAWLPVLEKISAMTHVNFEIKILPSIPEFEDVLFKGGADFAFMNPYHFIVAHREQSYLALIRDSKKLLEGIIVIRKDSPINSLEQLNEKQVAFPAPNAFASSLFIRAMLAKNNIHIYPQYVKSHSNVYRSVLLNDYVAGGGVNNTFKREPEDIQEQLKILYITPQTAPHPIAVHPRVEPSVRTLVEEAFLKLATDPANNPLLDAIQIPQPVHADYSKDYQILETMNLDSFFVKGSD